MLLGGGFLGTVGTCQSCWACRLALGRAPSAATAAVAVTQRFIEGVCILTHRVGTGLVHARLLAVNSSWEGLWDEDKWALPGR